MSGSVREVGSADFDEVVLKSDVPVVVDFWAPWCGPCRMVGPEFEKLSAKFGSAVKFVKLNVDEAGDIAGRYGVMSIPTIGKFSGGKMVGSVVGARSADALARDLGIA